MLSSKSIVTAAAVGALAGSLFAVWSAVAANLGRSPVATPSQVHARSAPRDR